MIKGRIPHFYHLRLCISMLAMGHIVSLATGQDQTYSGDVEQVRVISSLEDFSNVSKLLVPHIVAWKDTHLIAAFETGIPGKVDMGDIISSISGDDGDTWGNRVVVFDHRQKHGLQRYGYANPILYKVPNQNLVWCFAMRNPLSDPNSQNASMVAAFSADGGESWSHVELIMHYKGDLVLAGNLIRILENDGSSRFLIPAHCNTRNDDSVGGKRLHFVLQSKNLIEWELLSYVPQPPHVFLHEGHLAPGDYQEELILVMRTSDHARRSLSSPRAWQSVSKDSGKTWGETEESPMLYNAVSEAAFGKTAGGVYYYIYNDGPDKGRDSRKALKYKLKYPGHEWSDEKVFFDAGVKNSYPSVVEVHPGDLQVVWDSGSEQETRTKIYYGRLRVPDKLGSIEIQEKQRP
ncbi:sialidase family protein [Parapedobacter sp. 2B3]|uniref:sialidase family protein n=1 Tax=Parapedobacter sp. 2B3 TaxID=3342381 RepID=UPI0035B5F2B8